MQNHRPSRFHTLLGAAVLAAGASFAPMGTADAQAANYPAFQPPLIVQREYAIGVADGDHVTSAVFQWREGWSPVSQLSLDIGVADPEHGDVKLLLGGGYARQLNRASNDLPLDLFLTAGAYVALTDPTVFQIPVGISAGHRFDLDGGLALTPYIHPRLALSYCSDCGPGNDSDSDLDVVFDLGANFEVSPRLSLRAAVAFGGDRNDAIGFALAWRPGAMRR
jgi:hypothetical protein